MLSENLYALRRKNGLSQEQLAERIGVSRQAISKWETGLSTPELEKLKALSECFQVTIDELAGNQIAGGSDDRTQEKDSPPRKAGESRIGLVLCLIGAACLILFGAFTVLHPSSAGQINESSTITLNGTGILAALFVLLMLLGMILIFRRK